MRTVKTNDGQEITGMNSNFEDRGDHIVKQGVFSETRIYKQNIVSDKESNTAGKVATAAIGAALGVPFIS